MAIVGRHMPDEIYALLDSGTHHMKTVMLGEYEMEMDNYVKDIMRAYIYRADGEETRTVIRDGNYYVISDTKRTVMIVDIPADDMPEKDDMSSYNYIGSGSDTFNGATHNYDEYTGSNGIRIFYFIDGGKLIGIRSIVNDYLLDMMVTQLDGNVPDSVFEIPKDYAVTDMTGQN